MTKQLADSKECFRILVKIAEIYQKNFNINFCITKVSIFQEGPAMPYFPEGLFITNFFLIY